MGVIDLTVKGTSRIVTDRTLDREGFYIPEPPQRYNPRAKSAIGLGKREYQKPKIIKPDKTADRPKSAFVPQIRSKKPDFTFKQSKPEHPNQGNENEISDLMNITTEKLEQRSVNQKWVYPADEKLWRRRKSYVPKNTHQNKKDIVRQQISVCEVMKKMRSNSNSPDYIKGFSAPPSSPKTHEQGRHILGRKFIEGGRPKSAPEPAPEYPNYMTYARSKPQRPTTSKPRNKVSFLQEDLSIKRPSSPNQSEYSHNEAIEIPTMDMFTTDDPDEESVVVIDDSRKHPSAPARSPSGSHHQCHSQNQINRPKRQLLKPSNYKQQQDQLYQNVYHDHTAAHHRKLPSKPKPDMKDGKYVRYNPGAFRFQDKHWDKRQPRPKFNDPNRVNMLRRPNISQSLYVGVS